MIQTIWLVERASAVILYPNCRDCGKPIPPERWELGLCEAHWRLFTRKDNPKQRRLELEKPVIESFSLLDDISPFTKIQFNFLRKSKPIPPEEKATHPNIELPKLYHAKPTDENLKEGIQRRIDLVVVEARKRKAAEIAKAEREAE